LRRASALHSLAPLLSLPARSIGRATFWAAVSLGMRLKPWKTNPTFSDRSLESSPSPMCETGSPWMYTVPDVGTSRQPIMLRRVLFPEPLGPVMAVNSPSWMARETSLSALESRLDPSLYVLATCSSATALLDVFSTPPG
jgi:hypothetical protein